MRLNQFLAKNLGISRREADKFIERKDVLVNSKVGVFTDRVDENDNVEVANKNFDFQTIQNNQETSIVLFYKPIFCVTTRNDEFDRKTIYNYLPKEIYNLKPAGRLDYMSEGLLVLSNDGNLINQLTHPSFETKKTYLVGVKTPFGARDIEEMRKGLVLDDYKTNPVEIKAFNKFEEYKYLKLQSNLTWYQFTLNEGRNNQIRRMCTMFGQKVTRLIRIKHGKYEMSEKLYKNGFIRAD